MMDMPKASTSRATVLRWNRGTDALLGEHDVKIHQILMEDVKDVFLWKSEAIELAHAIIAHYYEPEDQ